MDLEKHDPIWSQSKKYINFLLKSLTFCIKNYHLYKIVNHYVFSYKMKIIIVKKLTSIYLPLICAKYILISVEQFQLGGGFINQVEFGAGYILKENIYVHFQIKV